MNRLQEFVKQNIPSNDSDWAWRNYKQTVQSIIRFVGARRILEIGGGRFPLLSENEAAGFEYWVNDISQEELDRAPDWVRKVPFDISGTGLPDLAKYDVVFSHMVFEHVPDGKRAYANIAKLLAPGGIGLNFHPVLYSPPFILNWLMPNSLSSRALRLIDSSRHEEEVPKFPAHYSYCCINPRMEKMLEQAGFSEIAVMPFYGHNYFAKLPGLREVDRSLSKCAASCNLRALASYSYTMVQR